MEVNSDSYTVVAKSGCNSRSKLLSRLKEEKKNSELNRVISYYSLFFETMLLNSIPCRHFRALLGQRLRAEVHFLSYKKCFIFLNEAEN